MTLLSPSSYRTLSSQFFREATPSPLAKADLLLFNEPLACDLQLPAATDLYAGHVSKYHLKSLALAYAGHQFGHFVPLLGDGRAHLLGEVTTPDGRSFDIQLKGSGTTPYSRGGDGRAPLSAVLREYLISEAMHGLNIPTTRALAVISSQDKIYRQQGMVTAGILTRVAQGSLRVGSFEFAASLAEVKSLKQLTDYAIKRHYPEILTSPRPYLEFYQHVLKRQAQLIALWMSVGFIHGVMNTDNMSISGETLDYGPCAFMDEFDLKTVFSYIDQQGRYAFGNQANIAYWNLAILAQSLAPIIEDYDGLQEQLNLFPEVFRQAWHQCLHAKLGIPKHSFESLALIEPLFVLMQQEQCDYTNTFRLLGKAVICTEAQQQLEKQLGDSEQARAWVRDWLKHVHLQQLPLTEIQKQMNQVNPVYIPRNHLVEQVLYEAVEENNLSLLHTLLPLWQNPFTEQPHTEQWQQPASPQERVPYTFCGT
ncbi:MAG: hypothetical protein BGO90_06700 [Legionella sp. 40-6]|nr:YdiU family protein [Legionella sp.]OJY49053.1 MAG: hypothetical protein BGO90_06700 [Legionella sp. 40-6]